MSDTPVEFIDFHEILSGTEHELQYLPPMALPSSTASGTSPRAPRVSEGKTHDHYLARKKAMLVAWVARLNVLKNNAAYRAIERRISKMPREVRTEEQRGANTLSLEKQIDTWLASNAGKVGGPEQEQDPARPHSPGWHGERPEEPTPAQQR